LFLCGFPRSGGRVLYVHGSGSVHTPVHFTRSPAKIHGDGDGPESYASRLPNVARCRHFTCSAARRTPRSPIDSDAIGTICRAGSGNRNTARSIATTGVRMSQHDLQAEAEKLLEPMREVPPRKPGDKLRPSDELRVLVMVKEQGMSQKDVASVPLSSKHSESCLCEVRRHASARTETARSCGARGRGAGDSGRRPFEAAGEARRRS
jgi:hypothetical protein